MDNQKIGSTGIDNEPCVEASIFETPRVVVDPNDCNFYHAMTLPGLGEVGREWDLRNNAGDYLGNADFAGKRVLDVGTASGFLTFEMERRGADVVSFDMKSGRQWNLVPHYRLEGRRESMFGHIAKMHERLQNAYWYAHRALGSNAKVNYGDVYDISESIGKFDIVLFGMLLSHLRDPFQALWSGSRLSTDTVIVTNPTRRDEAPASYFLPDGNNERQNRGWWSFTDGCIERMLQVLGFVVENKTRNEFKCIAPNQPPVLSCTTFLARRIELVTQATSPVSNVA